MSAATTPWARRPEKAPDEPPLFLHELIAAAPAGARVVDAGCGPGSWNYADRPALAITGFDIKFPPGPPPRAAHVGVVRADLARTPLEDGAFDLTICHYVLEHVTELRACRDELARITRPGGTLYVAVPRAAAFDDRLYRFAGYFAKVALMKFGKRIEHQQRFDLAMLKALFAERGLTLEALARVPAGFSWMNDPRTKPLQGPFTDAVAFADGDATLVAKVPTTPADPAAGLVDALGELVAAGVPPEGVRLIVHGTTIATNALITGRTARVVLLTTEGFRDVLGYRAGTRPHLYDLEVSRPAELVRRRDRIEVHERVSGQGDVLTALTPEEIERAVSEVADRGPEAVAVSFLFSYLADGHERAVGEALARRLPGVPVSLSSEVAREFREYPRTATTALNAALRPVVGRYLLRARSGLEGIGLPSSFLVMQSSGGSVPAERADREAHRLILSGPAAGVTGAVALGARYGLDRLVSLDMGGTSLDVCLVREGELPMSAVQVVDGHPILAPAVDVVAVGAGGGSIARVDAAGALKVGPQSAGADPGPAAYGLGGKDPTVTDAQVVVGALGEGAPLAGRVALDRAAADEAVSMVGAPLGLDLDAAAEGVIAVATAHMVGALRRVSIERGVDPRGYTLAAFGGAGPLHAGRLLRELGFAGVVIPTHPGLFSAAGLVSADLRLDESQTVLEVLLPAAREGFAAWYADAGRRVIDRLRQDGMPRTRIRLLGSADCRYLGQGYELNVPLRGLTERHLAAMAPAFHELHAATYGHAALQDPIEVVTLRLSAFGAPARPEPALIETGGRKPGRAALSGDRPILLPGGRRPEPVPVYRREALRAGNRLTGPAVVEEMDSVTLVLPGQRADVDRFGSLWLREERA
ncbi:MAG: methyltransferase domain-containing protein [Actinobacteria bacterium]|nr:methyltransferase domain-containing protein [Actinomycetota bacterium]